MHDTRNPGIPPEYKDQQYPPTNYLTFQVSGTMVCTPQLRVNSGTQARWTHFASVKILTEAYNEHQPLILCAYNEAAVDISRIGEGCRIRTSGLIRLFGLKTVFIINKLQQF